MKAVQAVRHGRPMDVIEVRDIPEPDVGPGEIRVAVAAASVNYGDIARTRGGTATVLLEPPFTLGMDLCGVVDAAGDGAEAWVGRRVVGMSKMSFGGMAEYAISTPNAAFDAPAELDDVEAAGFLLPYHVGYLGLHTRARIQPGETVLVTAASSGVGTAAMQLAVAAGANVIALGGDAGKRHYCESMGATAFIDYSNEDVFDRTMELTDGRGAEIVFDLVGGELTEPLWTCVAREGRYLPVGFNGDSDGGLTGRPLRKVSIGNFSVLGVMLSYSEPLGPMRRMGMNPFPPDTGDVVHTALCELVAGGHIRPSIGRRIRLDEVAAILEEHEARRTMGRTVVDVAAS